MPELYSGMQRDPTDFPVQYLGANVPQAWAAGSCFAMLQMIVGFQPDAPAGKLYIDPALPVWLPELTIRDLQVGENVFDLRFWRDGDATRFETLKGDPARRRPEELRHGHRAMAVARYQIEASFHRRSMTTTRPTFARRSSVRELPPPRTTDFSASKLRYANSDAATGKIGDRTVKMP